MKIDPNIIRSRLHESEHRYICLPKSQKLYIFNKPCNTIKIALLYVISNHIDVVILFQLPGYLRKNNSLVLLYLESHLDSLWIHNFKPCHYEYIY